MSLPELEPSIYDEEEGKTVLKSRRIPDMHGGTANPLPSAQSASQELVEPSKSEAMIDKVLQERLKALFGEHAPKASLPVLVNLLHTQVEALKTLKYMHELMEFQIPLGQIRSFSIAFPAQAKLCHIDFADELQTYGIPSGVILNTPNRKLQKLKIMNDGPATIKFSSNIPKSDQSAEIQLNSGEQSDQLDFLYNVIWSINIIVVQGSGQGGASNTTIRVFYVV